MRQYRIACLDPDGRVTKSCNVQCRDDIDALGEGEKLCADQGVEVWQGERLVARIKPGNAPLAETDPEPL